LNTGDFDAACRRFERAVEEKEKGDVHGGLDHASLGASVHQMGNCLFNTGNFVAAVPTGNPKWLTSPFESVDNRPDE
jgi:hypothetical protein